MKAMMMKRALRVSDILDYAAEVHPTAGIVSARTEGDIHHQTYPETRARVAQLTHALKKLGVADGQRVATLAWNTHRHFELYYAIPAAGGVCHTINPRLSAEQMVYITHHADDRLLFTDTTFVPVLEALYSELPAGLRIVVMTDRAHMPDSKLELLCYEELLDGEPETFDWPEIDENDAMGLCYTSGTTGHPKGALYSHRSTVLHAMMIAVALPDALQEGRKVLPVVPMFHVNAWGLPYAGPLTGVTLVMPGPNLDGEKLWHLMDSEDVYSAWGVPTVWLSLLAAIKEHGRKPHSFHDVVIGGSAAPRSMIETFEDMGVNVCHAWGMTEMSPLGTQSNLPIYMWDAPHDEKMAAKAKQGRRVFGVDLKIVDANGNRLPHDGETQGALHVRGNSIVSGYFNNEEATREAMDAEGWFATGDIALIDKRGYLTLTDRAKDLIKSGGEWISSIDLENVVMAHPKVANCAAIAVPHPKWDERPVIVIVPTEDGTPERAEIMEMLSEHFAKWQLPDDIVFTDTLPMTATGKVSKLTLRQRYQDHVLPSVE
ncbi:MAG: long-chain fatty acid--CoA ligase [Rhodobacterales bacterium]|nr:MAG: long-chain fatty acid--CoA ligase [Rhodobacterales bacterium]